MFRCVFFSALLWLVVSPSAVGEEDAPRAGDEGPRLWEDNKLTEAQPFPGKVLAVESGWGGYRLFLESAGDGEKRYCIAQVWPAGAPHLGYREIGKAELPKPGVTIVYLDPAVEVDRFSWSMGPWTIGRTFGDEDCLKKAVAMEAKSGRGSETGKFIILPGDLMRLPEGVMMGGGETDPVKLKTIYDRYTGSKFADIAHELARELGENPDLTTGIIPAGRDATPWGYNLSFTLRHAWEFHTDTARRKEPYGANFELLLSLVEDAKVGPGRTWALHELSNRLYWGSQTVTGDGSLPPMEETIRRLRVIALDKAEKDFELRREIVRVIYQHGDPNEVLDLAIELSSREGDPHRVAAAFQAAMPVEGAKRLTKENRAKYLSHGFLLLGRIDDGKSGTGYFLAGHLGSVIGIEPVRQGQSPFAPDQRLPEYQGKHGLGEAFFQKTVDEAMAWWEKHRGEYE
jgi:hypothetical protein